MPSVNCWDAARGHHGPCCMVCIIEETDRRAGAEVPESVRQAIVVDVGRGGAVLTVRACCFHWNWMDEAVGAAAREAER